MPTPIRADGALPTMSADSPITEESIRRALLVVARVITECNRPEYGPLLERLERELQMYKEARDPVSRARAILQAYDTAASRPAATAAPGSGKTKSKAATDGTVF
ncbi:hypothetical protein RAD15_15265 [Bradyrhizobium sp. 14AA]